MSETKITERLIDNMRGVRYGEVLPIFLREVGAAGERFGIFVGLWAPTFMAIGNGIDNLSETK